jgi:hypothetical protein
MPGRLNALGISFLNHFKCTGDLTNISKAISSQQKAVQLTPKGHINMLAYLNALGTSLMRRFEHTGDLTDISEAISSHQKAVQLTPESHMYMPSQLNNLGNSFLACFERAGNLTDISEAISFLQKAVQLTPEGHAEMPARLNNLGNSFRCRFKRTGDFTDISEAVSYQQKAVQLTPEGHANMPAQLNNLGTSFLLHFKCTGDLTDLSKAVSFQQKAVQLTPEGHAGMPGQLNNLAASFMTCFECTRGLTDISKAISFYKKAVQLTPEGHPDMPLRLTNLGSSFVSHFESTGDFTSISNAISLQRKAVQLTPEGHTYMPFLLNALGMSFEVCFKHTEDPADAERATSNYRQSATYLSGPPSVQLNAAKKWAHFSNRSDSHSFQLLEASHTVIHLISLVAGLEQTIQKRYTTLMNISELSASAAATAFSYGEYDLALEWLEQGRCLVWRQLNDLRSPLDNLRIHNPALADDLLQVSKALENAGSRAEAAPFTAETSMMEKMSIQEKADAHIKLAKKWDQLLTKVRAIPNFEDFLRPASCSTLLKHLPDSGAVVVINVHKNRSDALALLSGTEHPLHIALHEFSYKKADKLRHDLKDHLFNSGVRIRESEPATRGLHYKSTAVIKIHSSPIMDFCGEAYP